MNAPVKVSRYSLLPTRPRMRSDHEFLAPALEVLETPPSPVKMALLVTICLFATTALVWSYFGQIDIIAAAQGKIQPTGRVKVVQPLLGGKVKTLPPQNGEHVKQGDILLELDQTDALADEREASRSLAALQAEVQRRKAAVAYVRSHRELDASTTIGWSKNIDADLRQREDAAFQGDLRQQYSTIACNPTVKAVLR